MAVLTGGAELYAESAASSAAYVQNLFPIQLQFTLCYRLWLKVCSVVDF